MSKLPQILAFDIETIPDVELMRKCLSMPDASDEEVVAKGKEEALAKSNGKSDFLPVTYHQVACVSVVLRTSDNRLLIQSKGHPEQDERQTVEGFFGIIDKLSPTLVSWNGQGFDLPVLNLRAMKHGLTATTFWTGPGDKWNQYTSRFHDAHLDLMDLTGLRGGNKPKLEHVALACDLPGKMGYGGDQVHEMYLEGRHKEIKDYCEFDALNTYLLLLRYYLVRGNLTPQRYDEECVAVEEALTNHQKDHLTKFAQEWRGTKKQPPDPENSTGSLV